jgi:hypothetical protein
MRALLLAIAAVFSCEAHAAATASGRNWRLAIDSLQCEGALITLATRIRYLGPKGPVESPLMRLVDAKGAHHLPTSLVWKRGSKPVADWLAAGGLTNLQSEDLGEVQLRFAAPEAGGELRLEFGDIPAFVLTRNGCAGLLKPDTLQAPRVARAAGTKPAVRFYRGRYPCAGGGTVEAGYPPYLPRQLLVFGRGYLPSAREIELPMGKAAAQAYAYAGPDDLKSVEDAARRALGADFPELGKSGRFAFDWGLQKGASGNEVHSIGIYDLRACPGNNRK